MLRIKIKNNRILFSRLVIISIKRITEFYFIMIDNLIFYRNINIRDNRILFSLNI